MKEVGHSARGSAGGLLSRVRRGDVPHGLALLQMQMDVAFSWRPLAPLHHLLLSWGAKGLQLPAFTTEHTITLTIDSQSR